MRQLPPQAGRQRGVFTAAQAIGAGWSQHGLDHAVSSGKLLRLRRGVFAEPADGAARTPQHHVQQAVAAALAISRSALSHTAAAAWHDLPVLEPSQRVCLTMQPGTGTQQRGIHLHRRMLGAAQLQVGAGVPVTSIARTCLDLAAEGGLAAGLVTTDAALNRHLLSRADLHACFDGLRGTTGSRAAQSVLRLADGRSESALESVSRWALFSIRPAPELQVTLRGSSGQPLGRADFYWHEYGVVGEADGRVKYGAESWAPDTTLWAEKRRQDAMTEHNLVVVRWGWVDVRQPAVLVAKLQRGFTVARRLRAAGILPLAGPV